jgi:hemerythrin-like domain-containing protein
MMIVAVRKALVEPIPASLLAEPLNYIFADHFRQRVVCGLIEELADGDALDVAKATEVAAYIGNDLAVHVVDEEDDLFPLLRRRCEPEDDIDAVLGKLDAERTADEQSARDLADALKHMIEIGAAPRRDPALREKMLTFARSQRRHLMVENNIVLPIARVRLDAQDLANLARRMAARRGGVDNTAKTRIRRRGTVKANRLEAALTAKRCNCKIFTAKYDVSANH